MRKISVLVHTLVIFAVFATMVYRKEAILAEGTPVLLELVPRDPRAPMLGDYMALEYKASQEVASQPAARAAEGLMVLDLDDSGVGHFHGFAGQDEPIGPRQIALSFRTRGADIRIGAESFSFPEGSGPLYENACYAELRVAENGSSILVGLRDAALNPL